MFDWDELKVFLVVARGGSTSAAARALGVNQTTVVRRLEGLERSLGLRLVERSQSGAEVTEAGRGLLADCEAMGEIAGRIGERAQALRRQTAGAIRISCSELTANLALSPLLVEFRQLHPDIAVEMLVTDAHVDLQAGEADVALRGTNRPLPDSDLVARKVFDSAWGLYCSADYAARRGLPRSLADLDRHALITGEGAAADIPGMRQVTAAAPNAEIALRSNSLTNIFHAIRAGFGVGPMPCIAADADRGLIQVLPLPDTLGGTWVVTRRELKDTPRVRAFLDFIVPRLIALTRDFEARAEALRAERQGASA